MDPWLKKQQRHFDESVEAYRGLYGGETPFQTEMTRSFLALAGIRGNERVLDLGCGLGRVTLALLRKGCRVTGLDLSRATLESLGRRVKELGLQDRFSPLPLPAERLSARARFDRVLGRGLLHHLEDPLAVLRRVRTALVPGGRAAFMDPNPWQPAWAPFILLHPALSWSLERRIWGCTAPRQRRLLESAGFVDIQTWFAGLIPPPLWGRLPRAAMLEAWLGSVPGIRTQALYLQISARRPGDEHG